MCSAYTWGGNGIYVTLDPPLFTLVTEKKGRICVKGQREHVPEGIRILRLPKRF